MSVMTIVFAGFILLGINAIRELFQSINVEIFLIWELSYIVGGLLSYRIMQKKLMARLLVMLDNGMHFPVFP